MPPGATGGEAARTCFVRRGRRVASPSISEAEQMFAEVASLHSQGRFAACASLASGLESSKLLNRDAAMFIQCQCRFYAGQLDRAYRCFIDLQRRFRSSPHVKLAAYREADCAKELQRNETATLQYRRAANLPPGSLIDPAVGLYHRALSALRLGDLKDARLLVDELRTEFPDHPLAERIESMAPEMELGVEQALTMASKLHARRSWNQALAVLDRVPDPESAELRFELAFRVGRILFDMRGRYKESFDLFSTARKHAPDPVQAERAWFYASRALGRLDLDDQAIASHLAMAERFPQGRLAGRALFYAGWLELNQQRCDRAIPLLKRVSQEHPRTKWADEARWFVAWCQIKAQQWQEVVQSLTPQTGLVDAAVGGRADYWTGVAYQFMDRPEKAQAAWKKTITEYPLTWYDLLARLRLGKHAPLMENLARAELISPFPSRLFDQADELVRVGLQGMAVQLIRENEQRFLSNQRKRPGRITVMSAYHRAGHLHRPWLLAVSYYASVLRRLPTPTTRPIWEFSYPQAAGDLVRAHTGSDAMLTWFLAAIMRTESGFDPMARSVADARGLMQMTPETAGKISKQMGISYSPGDLFGPQYSLRMASWYIGRLVKKFHRQWPLAASAYNAGSSAMKTWCKENGHMSLDAFVEAIPWSESRRYAKRVTGAFARYAYLIGADLPKLSLEVNPAYLEDGLED